MNATEKEQRAAEAIVDQIEAAETATRELIAQIGADTDLKSALIEAARMLGRARAIVDLELI